MSYQQNVAARITFEQSKTESSLTESNFKKLAKVAQIVANAEIIALLTDSAVDENFVNRSLVASKRMNVYTVEKIGNALQFAARAAKLNDYTLFILQTAIKLQANDLLLSRVDAKDACSKHRKIADKSRAKFIVQNKETKDDSTVNAQHASSLDALLTLNVLATSFDADNVECYSVTDSPLATAMCARLAA